MTVYTAIVVGAILGVLLYGTASSALAQVLSARSLARWGPSLMLLVFLGAGAWGTVQGPVLFSPSDLGHLLMAPLARAKLVTRPLRRSVGLGACAGMLVAAVLVVGLTGSHRHVAVARMFGLGAGLGLVGVVCVALGWLVASRSRGERALRWLRWPVVGLAGGLAAVALAGGDAGRTVALWSGPWGWSIQAGAGVGSASWLAALGALLVAAGVICRRGVAGAGSRRDRALRPPLGGHGASAGLADGLRRADRAAQSGRGGGPGGFGGARAGGVGGSRAAAVRWLRRRLSGFSARRLGGRHAAELAVIWRDAMVALWRPGRVTQSALLAGGGAVLVLVDLRKPVAVVVGALLIYVASAWLVEPMRIELDAPGRASVFLGARPGRALLAHTVLPAIVVGSAVALCAAVLALAGALAGGSLPAALALVATAPAVTCCAGLSARRGGRLPQELLITAIGSDPSGGGLVLLGWLALWPGVAAAIVYIPVRAIHTRAAAGHVIVSVGLGLAALAVTALMQWRDPADS